MELVGGGFADADGPTPTLPPGAQARVLAVCSMVALCDGYDTQAIAFVAPAVTSEWGLARSSFGPVFSAGLAGLALGAFVFGPLADRWGRKLVILLCVAIFGLGSLATTLSTGVAGLAFWRAVTGLGLGGVLPNLITAANETVSGRFKNASVMLMICGFPLGATVAGFISAPLIAWAGWKSILLLGGVVPLALLPVIHTGLPNSSPAAGREQSGGEAAMHGRSEGWRVLALFSEGLALPTTLIWVAFFCNLLVLYFLMNWLPSLLSFGGSSLSVATVCTAVLNLGGIAGAFAFMRIVDLPRFGLLLGACYGLCVACLLVMVYGASSPVLLMTGAACAGAIVIGGQMSMNAFAASLYPQRVRSTGVGWALGFGRLGSIVGPLAGSALIDAGWQGTSPLLAASLPLVIASLTLCGLSAARQSSVARCQTGHG